MVFEAFFDFMGGRTTCEILFFSKQDLHARVLPKFFRRLGGLRAWGKLGGRTYTHSNVIR